MKLLEGIKIVTLETHVAVPGATRQLADWGAEVIKIEDPKGDLWRKYGSNYLLPITDEENALFTIENANKELISLNLKSEEGIGVIYKLLETADAFVSNVRYHSLENLGLDYDSLKEKFPKLVYYHFSSYGYEGPMAELPGFDAAAFWAYSGMMSDWSSDGEVPMSPSTAAGDTIVSGSVLSGLLAGLLHRERTGNGIRVTTSLYAAALWCNFSNLVAYQPGYSRIIDFKPAKQSYEKRGIPFMCPYKCKDGEWVYLCVLEYDRGVKKVLPLLGLEELVNDPRVQTLPAFVLNNDRYFPMIVNKFLEKTSDEWVEIFAKADLVLQKLAKAGEAVSSEQAWANDYLSEVEFANHNKVILPNPPTHFYGVETRPCTPAGAVGSDTVKVLKAHGYSDEQIQEMMDNKVVFGK